MKLYQLSLLNALVLVAVSVWAFAASGMASYTALIPAGFGVAIAACAPSLRQQRAWAAYTTIAIGILLLVALSVPLKGAMSREDAMAMIRIQLMMATTTVMIGAMIYSLIAARRRSS